MDIFRKADTMSRPMADTPKRRARRQFTDEFKASAVRLVLDESKTVGAVARDLDLTETALREWVKTSACGSDAPSKFCKQPKRFRRTWAQ